MKAVLSRLGDLIEREPVLFFGSTGLAGSAITLLVALGVLHLDPGVSAAITATEDLLVLIFLRSQVVPASSVAPPSPPPPGQ